ncbi:MAG: endoglycosylceramidase [Myxococcales bacterium]|nr:endoglycosylceramidase [Myxococcales bacterium]
MIRGITHRCAGVAIAVSIGILAACGSGCGHSGSDQAVVRPPRPTTYYVEGGAIRDPSGRSVVMRGVNLAGTHKQKPYVSDFQPADYARIKNDWGMNALRFLVSWAGLEPTRGVYDQTYLGEIEQRIGWAHDAGLLVVLDMHQDLFGEGFLGGDGAPRWTCDEARYAAFKPTTPWFFGSLDPNVGACFDSLWTNGDVRSHLVEAWHQLAMRLAKYDNVLGFDPINEPFWGTASLQTFEASLLAPFYGEVTNAVRGVAPAWLVFAEPSAARNLGFGSTFPKLPFDGVVYSPHAYDPSAESGNGFDPSHRDVMLQKISDMRDEASTMGASLFIGEYGGDSAKPGIVEYMTAAYDGAGAVGASTTYWAYDKKDDGYGLLHDDGSEKKELADVLTRPYPQRVAGKLLSYAFDPSMQTATIRWEPDATVTAATEIAVPVRLFPRGVIVDCGGCTVEEEPGTVRLRTSPPGNPVVVTIRGR